jgi:hypothetical protein
MTAVQTLLSAGSAGVGPNDLRARWDGLPDPVRRYLRYAIDTGTPSLRTARMTHQGHFRPKPNLKWFRIDGVQYFTVASPGFVWNASIRPVPFVRIDACDSLLAGRGNMLVKLASLIPIVNAQGAEIDQGARLRWLAECAWFPYGWLAESVRWEPIDGHLARVSLRGNGLPATAAIEVDDDGKLVRLRANRYRDTGGGQAVLTPWTGVYTEYQAFNGFRVPTFVDVAWELQAETFSYARFKISTLEYNVPGPV